MKTTYIFFLTVLTFFCLSCEQALEKCETCVTKEAGTAKLTIGNTQNSYKYWEGDNSKPKYDYKLYINYDDFTETVNTLTEDLKIIVDKKNVFCLVLFHDKIEKSQLQKNNIKGYQIYYKEDKNLITEIYKNVNDEMVLLNNLTSNVLHISSNEIFACSSIFDFLEKNVVILIDQNNVPEFKGNNPNLSKNITKHLKNKNKGTTIININSERCFSPCSYLFENSSCTWVKDGFTGYWHCPRPCFLTDYKSLKNPKLKEQEELARDFRDNYLVQTSIGKKYIDYYYLLSSYSKNFSTENINALKSIKPLIFGMANNYMLNKNHEIPVSLKEKLLLNRILNNLKNDVKDKKFLLMINDIKNDINKYSGMTIRQIKKDILKR